jgi:LPS-assembly lipoprotein
MNTQRRTLLSAVSAASLLCACGFTLRGVGSFSYAFQSLFSGFTPNSPIGTDFKRLASSQGLIVIDAAGVNTAQVLLRIHQEQRERVVVGTGVSGQVNAVQLRVRLRFSLLTTQGKILLDEVEILQTREQSYSESAALAKEAEEQLLYRDMQQEIAQQLLRRLSAVKSL